MVQRLVASPVALPRKEVCDIPSRAAIKFFPSISVFAYTITNKGRKPSEVTDVEEDEASSDLSSEDESTALPAQPTPKQTRSVVVHKTKQAVAPRKRRRGSDGGAYPLRQRREEVGEQSVRDHDGTVWDYE